MVERRPERRPARAAATGPPHDRTPRRSAAQRPPPPPCHCEEPGAARRRGNPLTIGHRHGAPRSALRRCQGLLRRFAPRNDKERGCEAFNEAPPIVIARWRKRAKRSFACAHAIPRSGATKGTRRSPATRQSPHDRTPPQSTAQRAPALPGIATSRASGTLLAMTVRIPAKSDQHSEGRWPAFLGKVTGIPRESDQRSWGR